MAARAPSDPVEPLEIDDAANSYGMAYVVAQMQGEQEELELTLEELQVLYLPPAALPEPQLSKTSRRSN